MFQNKYKINKLLQIIEILLMCLDFFKIGLNNYKLEDSIHYLCKEMRVSCCFIVNIYQIDLRIVKPELLILMCSFYPTKIVL